MSQICIAISSYLLSALENIMSPILKAASKTTKKCSLFSPQYGGSNRYMAEILSLSKLL